MKVAAAITGAVAALAFGVGIGVVSTPSGSTVAAAVPTPTTVTVTTPGQAKTVTPTSCIKALNEAESVVQLGVDFTTLATAYPGLVMRAARAGYARNPSALSGVTSDMSAMTTKITGITAKMGPLAVAYRADSAACRAGVTP